MAGGSLAVSMFEECGRSKDCLVVSRKRLLALSMFEVRWSGTSPCPTLRIAIVQPRMSISYTA